MGGQDWLAERFEEHRAHLRAVAYRIAASRNGDFDALLALLDPRVVVRADGAAVQAGASKEVHGAAAVATTFSGRARGARAALVNGVPGAVWAPGGRPRIVFGFTTMGGRIVAIELFADPRAPSRPRPGGPRCR